MRVFQEFFARDSRLSVDYRCIFKVNGVIVQPGMVCDVRSFGTVLDIFNVFFFSS